MVAVVMETIGFDDLLKVEIRDGTILRAEPLPQARKPAYVLYVDFGPDIGVLKSSAQITDLYTIDTLIGRQVVAVVNFPDKQIGSIMSQCLVTEFHRKDGEVVLAIPDAEVPNGTRLA